LDSLDALPELAPSLRVLDLEIIPNLASLAGIPRAAAIETLTLKSCNKVVDLGPLEEASRLLYLDIANVRSKPSLAPLANRDGLEIIGLDYEPAREDVDRLLKLDKFRLLKAARRVWVRDDDGDWREYDYYESKLPDTYYLLETYRLKLMRQ
jgi:hypothetical protein